MNTPTADVTGVAVAGATDVVALGPLRRQLVAYAVGLIAPYVLAIVVFWPP